MIWADDVREGALLHASAVSTAEVQGWCRRDLDARASRARKAPSLVRMPASFSPLPSLAREPDRLGKKGEVFIKLSGVSSSILELSGGDLKSIEALADSSFVAYADRRVCSRRE